ncbi:MAG: hypothetical protein H6983_22480 [Ectothiorhodospiraceae bacterium]|nr:hypothetical protein [Chromatiales bacterium]MCP5156961.1 hypothetical protein [Ectothiorhodospiraceae bacterium]
MNRGTIVASWLGSALLVLSGGAALADSVVADDQIVAGSVCAGVDCADGEDFDADTLRLKTADPRILFDDTSSTSAFPSNDWAIGVVSPTEEAASTFYIRDMTAGIDVMRLEPAADGGVALGASAELVSGAISVGASGTERRIVNVADGVAASDAATVGQFQTLEASVAADKVTVDAAIVTLGDRLDTLTARVDALLVRVGNLGQ